MSQMRGRKETKDEGGIRESKERTSVSKYETYMHENAIIRPVMSCANKIDLNY